MRGLVLCLALLAVAGCENRPAKSSPDFTVEKVEVAELNPEVKALNPTPNDAPRPVGGLPASAQAALMYQKTCAGCHGPAGQGDGPLAKSLKDKAGDWSSDALQKAYSDEALRAIILKGGAAQKKSALMPPYESTLAGRADLTDALVKLVRDFGNKPSTRVPKK